MGCGFHGMCVFLAVKPRASNQIFKRWSRGGLGESLPFHVASAGQSVRSPDFANKNYVVWKKARFLKLFGSTPFTAMHLVVNWVSPAVALFPGGSKIRLG